MSSASRITQEVGGHETLTTTVANTVAKMDGTDVTELEPLYETIDTDALNALLDAPKAQIGVTFEYDGHLVEVTKDGEVIVDVYASTHV